MWLNKILIFGLLFASPAWGDGNFERKREKRFLLLELLSNKTSNLIEKLGQKPSNAAQSLGHLRSRIIHPVSVDGGRGLEKIADAATASFERVGERTANVVNKSIGAAKTIAGAIFSDHEIHDIRMNVAKTMGLKGKYDVDENQLRSVLGNFFDPSSTRLLDADRTYCGLCKLLVTGLQTSSWTVERVGEFICNIYILLTTLTVSTFCQDIIKLHKPHIEYILQNSDILTPNLACTILLQNKDCYYQHSALQWRTKVPTTPRIIPEVTFEPNEKPLVIVHLSDFHISEDYEEGAVSNCGYPVCCLKGLGNPLKGEKAGRWGDYECDIPPLLLGATLQHLNHTYEDVDMVYFTGDIPDHTVWRTTIESNKRLIYSTYQALTETFPNAKIFSVIGNHEAKPLNVFPPNEPDLVEAGLSNDWLYELMAQVWRLYLPTEALKTVRRQGYYAVSVSPKLKVIGLNNNVCYNLNWWLLYNTTYLQEQLQFLTKQLDQSERTGQFVHILSHVPVGNQECIEPWEKSFNAIIERYSHIIKAQFNGHTHTDELKIFYDDNGKPNNVAFNGASLTPFVKYNPNYKIVRVQPSTMEVVDIVTYYVNLTDANLLRDQSPKWNKLYSMKEAYNLTDLSPKSVDVFAERLLREKPLQSLYWKNYVRLGDASLKDGCDKDCMKDITCKTVTTVSSQPAKPECKT